MREGIHPDYYQATVTCNCGNTFVTGSTKEDIHVEVCSKCHSFYTGQQKAARTAGISCPASYIADSESLAKSGVPMNTIFMFFLL